eukprot:CAMPEP_0179471608 /NCGR_PEP_ID=MMETSP0799-20121207/51796_1 /TAXON_ID=46947 /ORGANISM="Geminigera cryophila, Strain CCMP2564" /LENGTH=87 /DNA_ID=CAMNT_0021279305 /DNA_START=43 /DNA_END=303 /DNA_ORIENTATION=+
MHTDTDAATHAKKTCTIHELDGHTPEDSTEKRHATHERDVTCVTNLPQCQGDGTPNAEVTVHKTGGIAHGNADVPSGDEIEVKGDVT